MSKPLRIRYTYYPDTTGEGERDVLSNAYHFILHCHGQRKAASVTSTDGDDAKEGTLDDSRDTKILPD